MYIASVWEIRLINFQGEDCEIHYFKDENSALRAFGNLCKYAKENWEEFREGDNGRGERAASWFDCRYNEDSTYMTLACVAIGIEGTDFEWNIY